MKRLRVAGRLLSAVLLALVVRAVTSGINAPVIVISAIVAGLLVCTLVLERQRRGLQPPSGK
jgi:hypothetical protein